MFHPLAKTPYRIAAANSNPVITDCSVSGNFRFFYRFFMDFLFSNAPLIPDMTAKIPIIRNFSVSVSSPVFGFDAAA